MRILHSYIVLSTAWILKIVFVHHQVIKTHFLYWTHKELRQLLCMCNELIKIKQHVLWQQYNVQWFLTKRLYRPRVFDTKEYKREIYSIHITHDSILDFRIFKKNMRWKLSFKSVYVPWFENEMTCFSYFYLFSNRGFDSHFYNTIKQ